MNSILLSELQQIDDIGMLDRVVSGVPVDKVIQSASGPEASPWNKTDSEIHHWQVLGKLEGSLSGRPKADIKSIRSTLSEAAGLYAELESKGVTFERATNGSHLANWIRALQQFRLLARI